MKLHIGCGDKYLEGFKHFDARKMEHIDYVGTADDLSQFPDDSVEEIYACHLLEHIGRHSTDDVLKEWCRVIKPGGLVRIAVPNFQAIVEEYQANHNLEQLIGLLYGGQNYEYNFHHMAFDFELLKKKLEAAGFSDVQTYDWRDFLPEGYDDYSRSYLPHMQFDTGRLMSLNVIAYKK